MQSQHIVILAAAWILSMLLPQNFDHAVKTGRSCSPRLRCASWLPMIWTSWTSCRGCRLVATTPCNDTEEEDVDEEGDGDGEQDPENSAARAAAKKNKTKRNRELAA
eukprot:scaffold374413_cov31-Prasinocladus_malaysianus.AAC.1